MKWLCLLLTAAGASSGREPTLLASGLFRWYPCYVVLPDDKIIYMTSDGEMRSMDPHDPASDTVIIPDWNPREHGWEFSGNEGMLKCSPDGSLLLFTRNLRIPDSLQTREYVPGPLGIFLCGPDGGNTRLIALSMEVGGGPEFHFTREGSEFFGSPILPCPPTPEGMVEYWTGILFPNTRPASPGYLVRTADGSRSGGAGEFLADGFIPNPWSDLVACGAWPPDMIADASTGDILLELPNEEALSPDTGQWGETSSGRVTIPAFYGIIEQWVLPDAGLSHDDLGQILRYADGRTVRNPGPDIAVHGRLSDGRFLVSYGHRGPLLTATADWETFTVTPEDTLKGTAGLIGRTSQVQELPSEGAVVFRHEDGLYLMELP